MKLDRIDGFLPGISAYLSEPKQQAIFNPPEPQSSPVEFENILKTRMLVPHPQTRILSLGKQIYCNGENMSKEQLPDIFRARQTLSAQKATWGQQS
ncbi:hypothetical protein [Polynucleobacter necessarius]|uniref:hypothetical protein n=1 Tax=Polynucleobacter necessarius TaxID=576610 RepID=UPI001E2B015B|nr:hypothetical protein [Polynucleobacter necessarius]